MFGVVSLVRGFFSIARSIKGVRFGLVRHLETAWAHLQAARSIGEWCARRISLVVFSSIATVLAGSGDDYSADIKPTCSLQLTETGNDATKEAEAQAFRSRRAAGSAWYFSFFFFFNRTFYGLQHTTSHQRGLAQEHVTVGPTPLAHMDLGARKRSGQGGKCQLS